MYEIKIGLSWDMGGFGINYIFYFFKFKKKNQLSISKIPKKIHIWGQSSRTLAKNMQMH